MTRSEALSLTLASSYMPGHTAVSQQTQPHEAAEKAHGAPLPGSFQDALAAAAKDFLQSRVAVRR